MKSASVHARIMGKRTEHGPFDGKLKRFATSLILPIDPNRTGECNRCGACCKFLVECPFLMPARNDPNAYECRAYLVRPLQCRKYPRTKAEQIHEPCGYHFSDPSERKKTKDR